jgi:hypothetical protein
MRDSSNPDPKIQSKKKIDQSDRVPIGWLIEAALN